MAAITVETPHLENPADLLLRQVPDPFLVDFAELLDIEPSTFGGEQPGAPPHRLRSGGVHQQLILKPLAVPLELCLDLGALQSRDVPCFLEERLDLGTTACSTLGIDVPTVRLVISLRVAGGSVLRTPVEGIPLLAGLVCITEALVEQIRPSEEPAGEGDLSFLS